MGFLSKLADYKFVVPVMIVAFVAIALVQRNTFGIGNYVSPSNG